MTFTQMAIYSVGIGLFLADATNANASRLWRAYCYSGMAFLLLNAIERMVQP